MFPRFFFTFTEEMLNRAIRGSSLDGDIIKMPLGLDTPVGENGNNFNIQLDFYADSETPTATFPSFYERFLKNRVHYQTQLNLQSP